MVSGREGTGLMPIKVPSNDPNFMDIDNLPPGGLHCYILPDGVTFVVTRKFKMNTTLGTILIPPGFMTDGPSIPRRLRSVINSLGKHFFPAVLHDFWYRVPWSRVAGTWEKEIVVTKKIADNIFLQEMKDLKVPWWRRRLMWRMVGAFGGSSWREK